ncbi:hypothetical protein JIX56_20100 [Streptomyces sp. CA-210063]|uniref:hypothetical protein n=1 Tax=Streptomyces sp. CA-210063 TaxID=2801029 RepID=UPI00214CFC8D|nr:hypothetical protein [Streptomyces sp. CA-210063]UUU32023.1 hypothetical protein JIX56_20100 [Streptomyces sp. CA-210063]
MGIPDILKLSQLAQDLYVQLLDGESVTPERSGAEELLKAGLAAIDPADGIVFPLNPYESGSRALARLAADHRTVVRQMSKVAQRVLDWGDLYQPARSHGSEYLGTPELVQARLKQAADAARTTIRAAQPGPRRAEAMATMDGDVQAATRGVQGLTLYPASALTDELARTYVRNMAPLGDQFRVTRQPFLKMVVIDNDAAFIEDYVHCGERAAWCITDPALVAFCAAVFDASWEAAHEWGVRTEPNPDELGVQLQQVILRELAQGRTYKEVARRTSVSVSHITKTLAKMRQEVGVETNFQLAMWYQANIERYED